EEMPPDVILVRVGHERPRDPHPVGLGRSDDRLDLPRRIDHDALACLAVAHEVDEVLHRPELHLLEVQLAHSASSSGGGRYPSHPGILGRRRPSTYRSTPRATSTFVSAGAPRAYGAPGAAA